MGAFVGRQAEVAEITALLGRVRLVTLSGAEVCALLAVLSGVWLPEVCALLAALSGVWLPEVCDRFDGLPPAIQSEAARGAWSALGAGTCARPSWR
ncbi:hypothetical protein ABZV14_14400 [Streptosporangium canum]|uniref:hypothetical protein n=1 Tax=Streptosporangium canum TaxID=324952 RepID=UPI0033A4418D